MKIMLSILLALACFGCGGGSGGDSAPSQPPPAPPPPPPPAPLDHMGVWIGNMNYRISDQVLCRLTKELTCVLVFGQEVVAAIDVRNGAVNIVPPQWAAQGTMFDGGGQKPLELVGGSVTATTLTLDFSIDGAPYRFVGVPAAPLDHPGTSAEGVYTSAYMRGAISFRVDSNFEAFGQGGGGCTINGVMQGLAFYGYLLYLDLFHCGPPDDTYSGFGILTHSANIFPQASATKVFVFAVAEGAHWIGGYALK